MNRKFTRVLAMLGLATILLGPLPALAQVAPVLGVDLQRFSALGNSAVTGSTGLGTTVNGDVGSSPTPAVTNFPPSSVAPSPPFILHLTNDVTVQQAHTQAIAAYNFLAAQGPGTLLPAELGGTTLTPGIYSFAGGAALLSSPGITTGTLTLNDPTGTGIFIFEVASTLTADVLSNVVGTANPCNVYWRIGSSATLNGLTFRGQVFADASITVGSGSNVSGRLIAGTGPTGAVTMSGGGGNTIGGCASSAVVCPLITVNPLTLPNGMLGTPYNQTVSATPAGTYMFSLTGTLPTGLTLDGATGAITGVPTALGTFNFTITASDGNGCTGSRAYTIVIGAGVPTLDFAGLLMLGLLLAVSGLFFVNRLSS